jgi:hypothetical protein
MEDSVRWSLKVPRETDQALRAYLEQMGGRKGDLSRFVQEAVQARLQETVRAPGMRQRAAARLRARREFAAALKEVRARTRALTQAQVDKLVSEAVAYARKRR